MLCARSPRFDHGHYPFWLLDAPKDYGPAKPTTGLCAVAAVIERLRPPEIALIGFDRLLHPEQPGDWLGHDKHAEHRWLMSCGVRIKELHGEVC